MASDACVGNHGTAEGVELPRELSKGALNVEFDLRELDHDQLEAMSAHYDEQGFVILKGVPESVIRGFKSVIVEAADLDGQEAERFFAPDGHRELLPLETRKRLARISTDPALAQLLLGVFGPVLAAVMGPLIQVSNDFHCQAKGAPNVDIDYGGFDNEYMAVQGTYLPHQDFTGATFPTSPSFAVLWVGINDCPDWTMRMYPRTHRLGLICDRWFPKDHELLDSFSGSFDAASQPGTALLFNSLLLHGGTNPGDLRRVSCDIRFFPLCGFLPSEVHVLAREPLTVIHRSLEADRGAVLRAPLLEDLVFLGQEVDLEEPPPHSVYNWVAYVCHLMRGQADEALSYLKSFVNTDIGIAPPEAYISKYHGHPISKESLHRALQVIRSNESDPSQLAGTERFIANVVS